MILIIFINILLQVSKSEDCSKFGPHCSTCENGHCSKCDDGYGMDNDLSSENRGKCVECAYNPSPQGSCKNCNNDYKTCLQCNIQHGFDKDPDSQYYNKCRRCSDVSCDECLYDYTKCTKCEEGYGMNNDPNTLGYKSCDTCYGNCKICDSDDYKNCFECKNGYGFDGQGGNQCIQCEDRDCQLCKDNYKQCTKCRPRYGFDSNRKCQECDKSCDSCDEDSSKCDKCTSTYGKDNDINSETYGKCIKCKVARCQDCTSDANKCNDCGGSGFYDDDETSLTYGKCVSCSAYCTKCIDEKTCLECDRRYGLDNGKCTRCKDHDCLECYEDYSICTECLDLSADIRPNSETYGQCINCTNNCKRCEHFDSGNCTYCYDGLGSDNGVCVETKMDHCVAFESINYCIKCEKGYAVQHLYGVCLATDDEHCTTLHNSGDFCLLCEDNYEPVRGTCRKILNNCKEYYYLDEEPYYYCSKCEEGYGLDYNEKDRPLQCKKCTDPHCSNCHANISICVECQLPYYLDKSTGTCVRECKAKNCTQCNPEDNTDCIVCLTGYGYYENDGKPEKCVKNFQEHCLKGSSVYYCDECIEGYSVGPKGICVECKVSNCLKCSSDNYCSECSPGFYLIDGKCNECTYKGCECTKKDPDDCYDCIDGYTFDYTKGTNIYGKCTPCLVENCKYCYYHKGECSRCFNDEKPDNDGKCLAKPDITEEPIFTEEPTITEEPSSIYEPPIVNAQEKSKKKLSTGAIAGIAVGSVAAVGLASFLVYYFAFRKKSAVSASSNSP
ncbi:hypothetical protein M9Y10_029843 [Tritrichomonas musculus]|uniref:CXXC-rich protein n=1 Tax=Tritrichomonas musculus TaxID=1915356 RepID=A0ABR2KNB0_9EUKA